MQNQKKENERSGTPTGYLDDPKYYLSKIQFKDPPAVNN